MSSYILKHLLTPHQHRCKCWVYKIANFVPLFDNIGIVPLFTGYSKTLPLHPKLTLASYIANNYHVLLLYHVF